jgi:urease accessory protein
MTAHFHHACQQDGVTAQVPGRFEVELLRHGPHTRIGRQFVSYPFHLTRPFRLDADIPSLLSLYQQSCSGGLYRADRLSSRFDVRADAAAHITTQAATIVHDCHGQPVSQTNEISVGRGGFLAFTPDPLVLFPGASCVASISAEIAPGAVLLLADAFTSYDPKALSRPFDQLDSDVMIRDDTGRLLVRDSFQMSGAALRGPASPIGDWRVVSNYLLVGERARLPRHGLLGDLAAEAGDHIVAGVTELANGAGWGLRCLAADAVAAAGFGERLFSLAVRAALGQTPVLRRK